MNEKEIELSGTAYFIRKDDSRILHLRTRGFEVLEGWEDIAILPRRATMKSAGYDLHSAVSTNVPAKTYRLIPTGLTAYMQACEELQIRPRSGLAMKHGITVLNTPGTIDADYYDKKGHIQVLLFNTTYDNFTVNKGDRIAQAVFSTYYITDDDNPVSQDREGGFGHTGTGEHR